jgi:GMP synthase (glutamine-hydrolysing)
MQPVFVLRHVAHETLGTLASYFEQAGLPWQCVDADALAPDGGHLETIPVQQAAGLVVMGGPMNVDEVAKHPFLAAELPLIRRALAAEVPVLGICLGSQLLAKALDAPVTACARKEIGWYTVDLSAAAAEDRLFAGSEPQPTVFQWHGDTFAMPAGAVHLASSPLCTNQAFRYGRSAYGLQFHVEVDAAMIDDWLVEAGNTAELAGLDYIDPAAIRRQTAEALPRMEQLAGRVLRSFAQLCADKSQEPLKLHLRQEVS